MQTAVFMSPHPVLLPEGEGTSRIYQPLLSRYGYAALFVTIFMEGFGPPAPGQILLVGAAYLAARGDSGTVSQWHLPGNLMVVSGLAHCASKITAASEESSMTALFAKVIFIRCVITSCRSLIGETCLSKLHARSKCSKPPRPRLKRAFSLLPASASGPVGMPEARIRIPAVLFEIYRPLFARYIRAGAHAFRRTS